MTPQASAMFGVAPKAPAAPRFAWSTPARLRVYLIGIVAGAVLVLLTGETMIGRGRTAIRIIGQDAAPSVVVAQQLYASLADFDADVGNTLTGNVEHRSEAEALLTQRRGEVTRGLVGAAENITFGDAERGPILKLVERWTAYLDRVTEIRVRRDDGDLPNAIAQDFEASRLLHADLLTAATDLDAANRHALDAAYKSQQDASSETDWMPVILGAALCVTLLAAQVFCFRKMRRVVNTGLAASTIFALASTLYVDVLLVHASSAIHSAKNDAFESIHTLWRARALAYDANGEETRWLLDSDHVGGYGQAFDDDVDVLTHSPDDAAGAATHGGLFGDELHNITYSGERESAESMADLFAQYYRIDKRIRRLERGGKHAAAVELCLGESNAVFGQFDQALQHVIQINQTEFERVLTAAEAELRWGERTLPILATLVALLAFVGIRARLREYSV